MGITLKPVRRDEIPETSTRPSSESANLFREFLASDNEVVTVDVDVPDGKDPEKVIAGQRSSLGNYIDRHQKEFNTEYGIGVNLFTRNGALYIEKITLDRLAEIQAKRAARKPRSDKAAEVLPVQPAEPEAEWEYSEAESERMAEAVG